MTTCVRHKYILVTQLKIFQGVVSTASGTIWRVTLSEQVTLESLLSSHCAPVLHMAFNISGSHILSSSKDGMFSCLGFYCLHKAGTSRVWDTSPFKQLNTYSLNIPNDDSETSKLVCYWSSFHPTDPEIFCSGFSDGSVHFGHLAMPLHRTCKVFSGTPVTTLDFIYNGILVHLCLIYCEGTAVVIGSNETFLRIIPTPPQLQPVKTLKLSPAPTSVTSICTSPQDPSLFLVIYQTAAHPILQVWSCLENKWSGTLPVLIDSYTLDTSSPV